MNSVEMVKNICKERKIPISRLERDCGFSNGYVAQLRKGVFPADRLLKISRYLDVPISYLLTGKQPDEKQAYYFDAETAAIAEEIYKNPELRMLFDASRNASSDDLKTVRDMMLALKRKERGDAD